MGRAAIAAGVALLFAMGALAEEKRVDPAASDDCGAAVAARVQERYDGLRDLRARFEQESRNVAFGGASGEGRAAGRVWFAKPGRMRWEYETPEPSLVVSDGETLWLFDPVAREAQRLPVSRAFLSAAAIQFLLGDGKLEETFTVQALACGEESTELLLLPRQEATYERLELHVEPESGWIRETRVHDLFGNETRVRFSDLEADTGIGEERFRFVPEDDVRVLTLPGDEAR